MTRREVERERERERERKIGGNEEDGDDVRDRIIV
jgi:hypothetical protein